MNYSSDYGAFEIDLTPKIVIILRR